MVTFILQFSSVISEDSQAVVGGLSPSFATALSPEKIGPVCIFIGKMFVVRDPLFECMNKLKFTSCHGHGYGCFI